MYEAWRTIVIFFIVVVFIKAVAIGSDFSFFYWSKYGQKYLSWYTQRETWEEYLNK